LTHRERYLRYFKSDVIIDDDARYEFKVPVCLNSVDPVFSIVIDCLSDYSFILPSQISVLSQTEISLELIVVYPKNRPIPPLLRDPRILPLPIDNPLNSVHARAQALQRARGQWITFLQSDDFLTPQSLSERVRFLKEHPATKAVLGYIDRCIDSDGNNLPSQPLLDYSNALYQELRLAGVYRKKLLLSGEPLPVSLGTLTVQTTLARQLGLNLKWPLLHEWDFLLRLSRATPIRFLDRPLLVLRSHAKREWIPYTALSARRYVKEYVRFCKTHRLALRLTTAKVMTWCGQLAGVYFILPATPEILRSPEISILMPVYNREHYVAKSIHYVLAQAYPHFELIIIDDGSQDETLSRIRSIRDPRIRIISHPHNRGIAAALNSGLRVARGRFFTVMDSDDHMTSESLVWRKKMLSTHPDNEAVSGRFRHVLDADGQIRFVSSFSNWTNQLYEYLIPLGRLDLEKLIAEGGIPCPLQSTLFRMSLVRSCGFFDESLRYAFDWEWLLRVAFRKPILFYDLPTHDYRIHSGNNSFADNPDKAPPEAHQEMAKVRELYQPVLQILRMKTGDHATFRPTPFTLCKPFSEGALLIQAEKVKVLKVNSVGAFIWRQLNGRRTNHQISQKVSREFRISLPQALTRVDEYMTSFQAADLILLNQED